MQEILFAIFFLAIGFVLLIKGADFFVDGSSAVAKLLRVPPIIIGLTVVAMGTSLPELAVSVTAAMSGNNALAVSNVVGSNIFNLMVVCGMCAVFTPLAIQRDSLTKEFPFSIFCGVLLLALGYAGMVVGFLDGVVLLALFAVYMIVRVRTALKARASGNTSVAAEEAAMAQDIRPLPLWECILFIAGGLVAIKFGGDFVVDGATTVAAALGLSQNLIGLTIVAVGTSLPELVTSIVAARKKELDMALGNVIGSNIFNILLILGLAAVISPVTFIFENMIDIVLLTAMSLLVWIFGWTRQRLCRTEGMVMLAIYAVYLVYICIR